MGQCAGSDNSLQPACPRCAGFALTNRGKKSPAQYQLGSGLAYESRLLKTNLCNGDQFDTLREPEGVGFCPNGRVIAAGLRTGLQFHERFFFPDPGKAFAGLRPCDYRYRAGAGGGGHRIGGAARRLSSARCPGRKDAPGRIERKRQKAGTRGLLGQWRNFECYGLIPTP